MSGVEPVGGLARTQRDRPACAWKHRQDNPRQGTEEPRCHTRMSQERRVRDAADYRALAGGPSAPAQPADLGGEATSSTINVSSGTCSIDLNDVPAPRAGLPCTSWWA